MNSNGWLIYSKQDATENKAYIDWFIEEAQRRNISLKLVLREHIQVGIMNNKLTVLMDHSPTVMPTFAIVRTLEPLLNLQLEELGIHVFNSSRIARICNNKAWTHAEVSKLNVPMVDTLFYRRENLDSSIPFPFPFVVKEASGRGGKQVYFIQNPQQWEESKKLLTTSELIIQKSNVQLGKDIRVFVIGKQIVGAVLRSSQTDFRANFKLGGSATWYELSDRELNIVSKIINHFDFGMVGIDFLIGNDHNLLFNEIEDIVGSRTLSSVSNINILQNYITHIKEKISGNLS